jgi:phage baseplate assembly protein V
MGSEARSRSTDQRYYGVVEAIVTANDDGGSEGRVKIKFPWFDEQMETEWCRVRQFYAGNGYGAFFIPEVGDEVLVSFIHGDMRQPIILGGLYNGQDKPPSERTSDKDEKMIRTKAGHQITLDDSQGKEKIVIVDSKTNNSIEIDTVADSITIKSAQGKIILDAAQGIEIKSGQGVEVTAKTTIKIEADATLDIKGATVNIN